MKKAFFSFALVLLLSACGSIRSHIESANPGPMIPDATLRVTPSTSIALEKIFWWGVYASAAYLILDPLAPNWNIEEAEFPDQHVMMQLKMKRYYSGGAGEARQVLIQRAKTLMRQGGFSDYRIVEYSESLDSSILGSQRTATGVIALIGR